MAVTSCCISAAVRRPRSAFRPWRAEGMTNSKKRHRVQALLHPPVYAAGASPMYAPERSR
jgi:hypothetical protein